MAPPAHLCTDVLDFFRPGRCLRPRNQLQATKAQGKCPCGGRMHCTAEALRYAARLTGLTD